VLGVTAAARQIAFGARVERPALRTAPYAIGTLAAFWFFERLNGF
jgi:hypothetical protein